MYPSGNETSYITNMSDLAELKITELAQARNQTPLSVKNRPEYNETCRQLEKYSAMRTYIQNHPYDRPGVYAYRARR